MMPRNILDGKTWNCRKAKPEEWCSGFWPGVLWMVYKALGDKAPAHYRRTALAAADSLATLYNPKVGTILSWLRHVKDYGGHNTIMDNMINLESRIA